MCVSQRSCTSCSVTYKHKIDALFERVAWLTGATRTCRSLFNVLLPTLETLRRDAYEEIHSSVYTTIGHRPPAELAGQIFELTLVAEEIFSYPRVISPAVVRDDKHIARGDEAFSSVRTGPKTTLIYKRWLRRGVGRYRTSYENADDCLSLSYQTLECGPQEVASRVQFARNNNEKQWLENKRYAYHRRREWLNGNLDYFYDLDDAAQVELEST